MSELYWIGRLDELRSFMIVLVMCLAVVVGVLVFMCAVYGLSQHSNANPIIKKWCKNSAVALFVCSIIYIFIPTKQDMFIIYGLGGTIDYLKSNEKVQELPDKCINALDAWLESINETNK